MRVYRGVSAMSICYMYCNVALAIEVADFILANWMRTFPMADLRSYETVYR
jgi:hypothetical protein